MSPRRPDPTPPPTPPASDAAPAVDAAASLGPRDTPPLDPAQQAAAEAFGADPNRGDRPSPPVAAPRIVPIPDKADGMRLDRFLAARFSDRSRTWLVKGIKAGLVASAGGRVLRPNHTVRTGDRLHLLLPGIAPSTAKPPMPAVLHEDDLVAVIAKPPRLLCHPAGTDYAWSVIRLAKDHWHPTRIDLVHRLDRDTSGALVLTKDLDANRHLKAVMKRGDATKEYLAVVKGHPTWDHQVFEGAIGRAGGVIRIQMAVVDDDEGQSARTDATVLERRTLPPHPDDPHQRPRPLSLVRCRIHTGRTHQIRVHLSHAGFPLLGDRMYGVHHDVFLGWLEHGATPELLHRAGARRHSLHAARITLPHPDGHDLTVRAPLADDIQAWWDAALDGAAADPATVPWWVHPDDEGVRP